MLEKNYDFFISYNKADARHAKRIASVIKSSNLKCWWQAEDSKQEYALEIREAIKDSAAFIVLLSHDSAASEWVGREILDAIRIYSDESLKILPIAVEELSKRDYDYFHQILGNFNWLFLKDFASDKELIVAITSQVSMRLKEKSINSIYSAQAEIEQERLRKQNNLYNMYAKEHIDRIFSELENPCVLDVGCFDAQNIMLRLEGRGYSRLLCVDKDSEKISEAREKFGSDKITFLDADITRKGFIQKLREYLDENGLDGFDFIHISAVLLHIKNPQELLKSLHEVLSTGGYIFIQDEDDGFNIAFQEDDDEPSFFNDCFYIWKHSKESGDRGMARKLPIYLKKAGFTDIELKSSVISSIDFGGKFKEDLWDLYFNPNYWVVDSEDYFDKRDAYEKCIEYKKKHRRQKLKYMKDKIFITLGVLIYVAKK